MKLWTLITAIILTFASSSWAAVCSVQTTSTGWTWNCPQLPAAVGSVCKSVSEDGIDMSSGHSYANGNSRYATTAAWATALGTARMPNQGITTAGQYSYTYISNYPANGVPYEPTEDMGLYAQKDAAPFHLKNQAYVVTPTSMACNGSSFYEGETPDDWDPAAQSAYNGLWGGTYGTSIYQAASVGQVRDYVPDDGDSLFVYDSIPTHPDFGYILTANSPVQVTSDATWSGGAHKFSNTTKYVKIAEADYLAGEYGCVGSATSITGLSESGYVATATVSNSFTAGEMVIISGATPSGYNNGGYPVLVMPEGLSGTQFQYVLHTAGLGSGSGASVSVVESPLITSSTDPIGLSSCGSTKITSSLSALNTAWGTSFSTWGTSDANGLTGISTAGGNSTCTAASTPYACCTGNGTGTCTAYGSWGTGTGFLDESGSHILNSTFSSGCGTTPPTYTQNWGKTTQLQADAVQFVGIDGAIHASRQRQGYNSVCSSNCPPLTDLYYDSPNEVYQQSAPYFDELTISPSYYTTLASAESRVQTIINNDGGIPIVVHNYSGTPAVSGCDSTAQAFLCKTTESAVGTAESTYDSAVLRDQNPLGKYAVIGFGHWMGYDWNNTSSSGLYTVNDNEYDGSGASTLSTCTATWASNHTYTTPTCITDANSNHEWLMVAGEPGQTCTSGSSTPSWPAGTAANYGKITTGDGTCQWDDGYTYLLTAEAANSGNYLGPLYTFFTGSLCDPASSAGSGSLGFW